MATIISKASGNWSAPATWDTNTVPTSADTVTILAGHTVVLDVAYVIEGQLTNNGTLTLSADLTLGSGTDQATTKDGKFVFGPNSVTNGTAKLKLNCGLINSQATATSWAKVLGSVGVANSTGAASYHTLVDIQYVSFQTTGTLNWYTGGGSTVAGANNPDLFFKNCVFENYESITFGHSGYTIATSNISVTQCDFRSTGLITMLSASGSPQGVRAFNNNTYNSIGARGIVKYISGANTIENCVFVNQGPSSFNTSTTQLKFKNCLFGADINNQTIVYTGAGSGVDNCFIHNANTSPANISPRGFYGNYAKDSVFEMFGSTAKHFTPDKSSTLVSSTGNLYYGTGDAIAYTSNPTTVDAEITNNTVVRFDTGVGSLLDAELTITDKTTGTKLRNNLHVGANLTAVAAMVRAASGTISVDSDNNAIFNTTTAYASGVTNKSSGSHDFTADPMFKDSTRNLVAWINRIYSSTTKTYKDAYNYFLTLNGYDQSTKTQLAANIPASKLPEFLAYVREGFTPYNMNLATSGEGGTFVGAYMPKELPTYTVTITAQEKYLLQGTEEDTSKTLYPINMSQIIAAGWTIATYPTMQGNYGVLEGYGMSFVYHHFNRVNHATEPNVTDNVAYDADSYTFWLNHPTEGAGIFFVHINIVNDATRVTLPSTVTKKFSAIIPVSYDVGTNAPATVSLEIDGTEYKPGVVVDTPSYTAVLELDPLYSIAGIGGGGGMYIPAIDPNDKDHWYISSDMGPILESRDGGKYYKMYNRHDFSALHQGPGAMFCADGSIIFAGNSITTDTKKVARSTDNGLSWIVDKSVLSPPISGQAWRQGALIGLRDNGLGYYYFGDDLGVTGTGWTRIIESTGRVSDIAAISQTTGLYVYNNTEIRKFVLTSSAAPVITSVKTFATAIKALASSGTTLLASVLDDGLYKSSDAGESWTKIRTYEKITFIKMLSPERVYLVQTDISGGLIYKSTDGGITNTSILRTSGVDANVEQSWIQTDYYWWYFITPRGLAVFPGATPQEDLLLVTTQGEIYRSDNGGTYWSAPMAKNKRTTDGLQYQESIGLEVTNVIRYYENPHRPGWHHALYNDIGGCVSDDYGKSWASAAKTQSHKNSLYNVAFDPTTPGLMWGATSNKHDIPNELAVKSSTGNGSIDVSTNYGKTWSRPYSYDVNGGLPNMTCTDVVVDPTSPVGNRTLYAAVYSVDAMNYTDAEGQPATTGRDGGGVYKSTDNGVTWTKKVAGWKNQNKHIYKIIRQPSGNLYVLVTAANLIGEVGGAQPGALYKSTDGANTWVDISGTGNMWKYPANITFGTSESEIYVSTVAGGGVGGSGGLLHTVNGGATWEVLFDDLKLMQMLNTGYAYEHYIGIYVEGDMIVLSGLIYGPLISGDRGRTWAFWKEYPGISMREFWKLSTGEYICSSGGSGIIRVAEFPVSGYASAKTGRLTITAKEPAAFPVVINSSINVVSYENIAKSVPVKVTLTGDTPPIPSGNGAFAFGAFTWGAE